MHSRTDEVDVRPEDSRLIVGRWSVVESESDSPATTSASAADTELLIDLTSVNGYLSRILRRTSTVAKRSPGWFYSFAKRTVDIIVSVILLVLLLPLLLIAGLAIRCTSRGSVFFRHRRFGHRGVQFEMLKFRTMVAEADTMLDEMEELTRSGEVRALQSPVFKAPDDPRITRLGRILRRTDIDELPQLINVLVGHMSLVGPRPLVSGEIEMLDGPDNERRHSVRPGITCLWQVVRTEEMTFAERMTLDLQYVERRSALLDVVLALMTPIAIVRGARSY